MKLIISTIIVITLLATVVAAATMKKASGWYCYADGDRDYYEKATSTTKKLKVETFTFYEDNELYQYLGQEQYQNGVLFLDSYTKNDVTPGWPC